ncbi:hypothetical protein LZ31DRAFT_380561 [Colletotrichum somersetense]|nr:hypothetical protein LZ31DRAFT_380561 [Colletotrichum somersetense]
MSPAFLEKLSGQAISVLKKIRFSLFPFNYHLKPCLEGFYFDLTNGLQVSGPRIYTCGLDLVDLWKFKLAAARHRPFDAEENIFGAVSDIITASLFALNPGRGTTRQQLRHLESLGKDLRIDQKEHSGLVFPQLPPPPHYKHFQLFSDHQGDILKSPLPTLLHYYKMLFSSELHET